MSHHAWAILLVFVGGGIGAVLRHGVNQTAAALFGVSFPWGTVFVNVAGSLAMGMIASWFAFRGQGGDLARLFLTTGVLGGFTTFSAFSLDLALLWERGQTTSAALYAIASVILAVVGVFSGLALMRSLLS